MRITHQSKVWELPDAAAELWAAEQLGTDSSASAVTRATQAVLDRHAEAVSAAVAQRESAKHAKSHGEKMLKELEHGVRSAHVELFGSKLSSRLGEIETEKARLLDEIADARHSAGQAVASLAKLRNVAFTEIANAIRNLKRDTRAAAEDAVRRAKDDLRAGVEPLLGKLVRAESALCELKHTKAEPYAEAALSAAWPALFGTAGLAPFTEKPDPESDEPEQEERPSWVRCT